MKSNIKFWFRHEKKKEAPPQWAQRFLEWYCKPEVLEDLQGDLLNTSSATSKAKGLSEQNAFTLSML
jgi:hypothetical protein